MHALQDSDSDEELVAAVNDISIEIDDSSTKEGERRSRSRSRGKSRGGGQKKNMNRLGQKEREMLLQIEELLFCPDPHPEMAKLDEDATFSLEDRIQELRKKEVREVLRTDDLAGVASLSHALGASKGEWTDAQERARLGAPYLPYMPSFLLRKRLRKFDQFADSEKLLKHKFRAGVVTQREQITLAWLDNLANELAPEQISSLTVEMSKFTNMQALILRNAGLRSLEGLALPNLLYADLSHNKIQSYSAIIKISAVSPRLQILDVRGNPFCAAPTWNNQPLPQIDVKMGGVAEEWLIAVEFPDLVMLNGAHVTLEHHAVACARLGGPMSRHRVQIRHWDQIVTEAIPEIREQRIWRPRAVKHLALGRQRLKVFHVAPFESLLTLDLSNNFLTRISSCGLERCRFLWA